MVKKKESSFDVIIVGAGIAGCVLAFHLATANYKVKIHEKRKKEDVGKNWCDSIEKEAFSFAGIPCPKGEEKKESKDQLVILSPNLQTSFNIDYTDFWIVDRKRLQKRLLEMAEKAGVTFEYESEIIEPIGRGQWVVGVKKKDGKVENARLIVDCSGNKRILGNNIEVLDLNFPLQEEDITEVYRETHIITSPKLTWEGMDLRRSSMYFRYGYEAGFSWLNFEDKNIIDIGSGVGKGFSQRSPKAIVNEFVNTQKNIKKEKITGGAGRIITRRPITLVWYGFLLCGESASQINPTTGYGVSLAMKSAKIAAEVIIDSLRRKEVSMQRLWEYQVRFTKKFGKDLAALDMMRKQFLLFSEEELNYLMKKRILSKNDFDKLLHAKYPKANFFKYFVAIFKGITKPKLLWRVGRALSLANRVYKHYKNFPKEYDTRNYHYWLLEQLSFFQKTVENG